MVTRNDTTAGATTDGDPLTADCPGREIYNHITSRWSLLILIALGAQPPRFHALRDRVDGISNA